MQAHEIKLLIVTGLSGAGKTQAVRCLEDLGFFCVDNLPPKLIPKFAELWNQSEGKINRVSLVIDIRGGKFFDDLFEALENLKAMGYTYEILFLEASDETLVRRFKETRRRHPMSPTGRILDGIILERKRLEELRGKANIIIDTSNLKPTQLKEQLIQLYGENATHTSLAITVMSFGFKYGIPLDVDLLMDVRFLPNPYYIPELRELTGSDVEVQEYVFKSSITEAFLQKYYDLLSFLIPHYISEGKTHLVIAIGCTGGKHRSVALANKLSVMLENTKYQVTVTHRDVNRK